jgi:hypothetical protein
MFTQYKKKSGEVVELELTNDGGAVIRNPKDHSDERKISQADLRENYEVVGEDQEAKDKREFDERLKNAGKDLDNADVPRSGRQMAHTDESGTHILKDEPKPSPKTPPQGFAKENPDRVTKDK